MRGSDPLVLPAPSDASQCFCPQVLRPLETSREIRQRLEADGCFWIYVQFPDG